MSAPEPQVMAPVTAPPVATAPPTAAPPAVATPTPASVTPAAPASVPAPAVPLATEAAATLPLPQRWRVVVEAVRTQSPRHGASLAFARVLELSPGEVRVAFGPKAQFHRATLVAASGKQLVEQVFARCFGAPTLLRIDDTAAHADAFCLAEEEARARTERVQGAEQKVREHAALRGVLRVLGGEVEHIQLLETAPPAPPPDELPDPG